MKRILVAFVCIFVLASCADSSVMYDGNGQEMYAIACIDNQTVGGMTSCLKEAARLCPAGYLWQGSTNHPVPFQVSTPSPEMKLEAIAEYDIESVRLYNERRLNTVGSYGWRPRVTRNRGDYHYITVRCKERGENG